MEESDRDAGGKTLQAKFPPQAGLPSPFLPPSRTRIIQRKKKKYTIQSAKASEKLIAAPIPIRGKARRRLSGWRAAACPQRQDGLTPREGRGLGPAARLPAGINSFPSAAGAFGSGRYLGHVPGGWTKDATGTPGHGGDPVARADNGLVERWGRGWLETRRTEGWGRACREAPAAAALHLPATRWG